MIFERRDRGDDGVESAAAAAKNIRTGASRREYRAAPLDALRRGTGRTCAAMRDERRDVSYASHLVSVRARLIGASGRR